MAFTHSDVWIVGDTPMDVACGRHEGVRMLALATGRHGTEELGPAVRMRSWEDLRDLEGALRTLCE